MTNPATKLIRRQVRNQIYGQTIRLVSWQLREPAYRHVYIPVIEQVWNQLRRSWDRPGVPFGP